MTINAEIQMPDTVVLVTGGARGIGAGIAREFLNAGSTVVVCGRTVPGESTLPRAAGRGARFIQCDVRRPESVDLLFTRIASEFGRLDVLVNNAGGSPPADLANSSPRLIERLIQLNLTAPLLCAQSANRLMQQTEEGGSIVNIASVSGVRPSPGTTVYGAAKAGLLSATTSLAMEWGPKVRVNAVIAGLVATESSAEHYGGPEGVARIGAMLPMKRMATPEDIARACLFLSSPLASYVSGAHLAVHGGGERPSFLYLAQSAETNAHVRSAP